MPDSGGDDGDEWSAVRYALELWSLCGKRKGLWSGGEQRLRCSWPITLTGIGKVRQQEDVPGSRIKAL